MIRRLILKTIHCINITYIDNKTFDQISFSFTQAALVIQKAKGSARETNSAHGPSTALNTAFFLKFSTNSKIYIFYAYVLQLNKMQSSSKKP